MIIPKSRLKEKFYAYIESIFFMNNEAKIISLTPAVAGWWAKFTDETEWFSGLAGDIMAWCTGIR